jgi:hypothetical protein
VKKPKKFTQAEARWFQQQAASHRDEIRELRAMIIHTADALTPGGLAGRLLADELRRRLTQVKKT